VKSATIVRGTVAVAWGLVVSVGAYAITRGVQKLVFPEPDPATVAWSAHAGFFWRMWTVAYAGGVAAFVAWIASRGRVAAAAHALAPAIVIAAALLVLQSAFMP
jgi:choline-glycine betaine transporter